MLNKRVDEEVVPSRTCYHDVMWGSCQLPAEADKDPGVRLVGGERAMRVTQDRHIGSLLLKSKSMH